MIVTGAKPGLRESAELFRLLVDGVVDYAIFMLQADGTVASWNVGAERLKGYKASEIIGSHFSSLYTSEDREARKPERELQIATAEGRVEDEGWRVRKDGSLFWANVVITSLRSNDGELIGFAKVTRDMTERRRGEEILRQSEERFRLLVESVRDYAIFMLDPTGRIVSWNEGARRIKQYTPSESIGQHFSMFYLPEEVEAGVPEAELEVAARDGRVEAEGWRVRKDGSRMWANVIISAVRTPDGRLVGFSKVTRDLTERRRYEQGQLEALAQLSRSNQELDQYAAFVSHDLQEPLRKMASYAEVLRLTQAEQLDETGKTQLGHIVDGAKRMRTLIVDLLDYSRIGRMEPPLTNIDLDATFRVVREDMSIALDESNATLLVGPLPRVRGNSLRLQQVLQNLLSNAIKYRDPSRALEIRVDATRSGDAWIVAVRDNGIGFEEMFADRILQPFERLHPKETYPGSGLGLASCKKIVELHGGRLWACAEVGRGSAFFFSVQVERSDDLG